MAKTSDPLKDHEFQKVVRHFLTTPSKPHKPIGKKKANLNQNLVPGEKENEHGQFSSSWRLEMSIRVVQIGGEANSAENMIDMLHCSRRILSRSLTDISAVRMASWQQTAIWLIQF